MIEMSCCLDYLPRPVLYFLKSSRALYFPSFSRKSHFSSFLNSSSSKMYRFSFITLPLNLLDYFSIQLNNLKLFYYNYSKFILFKNIGSIIYMGVEKEIKKIA